MAQRQQIVNGFGGIGTGTVTVTGGGGGGGGDGVNNAGGNAAGIGNGSTGGAGGVRGVGVGGVSSTYYQNANTMQAAPGWAFQLLPSLYNHYQKVLRIHRIPSE